MPSLNPMGWSWGLCRGRIFSLLWAGGFSVVFLQIFTILTYFVVGPLGQTCLSVQFHIEFCHADHYSPVLSWPIVLHAGEHDHRPESAAEHSDLLRTALTSLISVFWYQVWNVIFIKMPSSAVRSPQSTGGPGPSFEFFLQSCIGNKRQISLGSQHSLKDSWYTLQPDTRYITCILAEESTHVKDLKQTKEGLRPFCVDLFSLDASMVSFSNLHVFWKCLTFLLTSLNRLERIFVFMWFSIWSILVDVLTVVASTGVLTPSTSWSPWSSGFS